MPLALHSVADLVGLALHRAPPADDDTVIAPALKRMP